MSYRDFIGMPNLLHKREIVKEFFQDKAKAENLFQETDKLIQDEVYRNAQTASLIECRKKLGDVGANQRAAENIHQFFVSHEKRMGKLQANAVSKG